MRKEEIKKTFEEVMVKIVPNLMKTITKSSSLNSKNKKKMKKTTQRHIIFKCIKVVKIKTEVVRKITHYLKKIEVRLTRDSSEIMKDRTSGTLSLKY